MRTPVPHLVSLLLACAALVATPGCKGERPPPNVLLIVVDTLRADRVGGDLTPNLNRLAERGLAFSHAQTPRAKTNPAVASLMTGLYPHAHGVRDLLTPLAPEIPTLAEALDDAGYRTAGIVGNYVLKREYSGLARGFDTWIEDLPQTSGVPPDDVPQRTATSMTDGALAAFGLAEPTPGAGPDQAVLAGEAPWFLYLHYMDPHGSYDPPAEYVVEPRRREPVSWTMRNSRYGREVAEYNVPPTCRMAGGLFDAAGVRARYDGEVRYVDRELGRLLEALEAEGKLENTIVVVTSDHGESLGEHDYWFEHGRYAFEATCRVPLIVTGPGVEPGPRVSDVSLTELAPWILEWCGLEPLRHVDLPGNETVVAPPRLGLLLADDAGSEGVFCEKIAAAERAGTVQIKAVRVGDWKLIRRYGFRRARDEAATEGERGLEVLSHELFDLRRDPREEAPETFEEGGRALPAGLQPMLSLLEEFVRAEERFQDLAEELAARRRELVAEDPERDRKLRALGY